jgi:hypothetical protein
VDDSTRTPPDPTPAQRRVEAAERRDEAAAARDQRAEVRDTAAGARDRTAQDRDRGAADRDTAAAHRSRDILDQLHDLQQQIDDQIRWLADAAGSIPVGGLSPAALSALRAYADEQRRLAELNRRAVRDLFDEMRAEVQHSRAARHAAADDRHAAADDRHAAADDRTAAAGDRDAYAANRDQAAIERAQTDPPAHGAESGPPEKALADRVTRAVAESQQRVRDSRAALARHHTPRPAGPRPTADPPDDAEQGPPG